MLGDVGIDCIQVEKTEGGKYSAISLIGDKKVDLVINVPREFDELGRPDGYLIRRRAIDDGVSLITDLQLARAVIEALRWKTASDLAPASWNDFLQTVERTTQGLEH